MNGWRQKTNLEPALRELDALHESILENPDIDSTATQYALLHVNEAMIQLDYVLLALENK